MIDQEKIVDDIMLDELEKKVPGCKEYINNTDNKKKRLGMLSVLGSNYNRDYFEGYRSLIEKEKVCAEYMSDIVYTLRNYIEVADTEIKTYGEVMTPLWLVEKMLDILPKHVWKNPKLKWLDPANGVGTFPSAIVKILMEGLKDVIPDSCERYQHIVENMIYVCEIQAKNMFLYHCAFDIDDTHKLNTYYGSFLSEEFDNHMKNVWGVEKFDIIIGNPPYNNHQNSKGKRGGGSNLWDKFVIKVLTHTLKENGYLDFVHPTLWRKPQSEKSVSKEVNGLMMGKQIHYLECHDSNDGMKTFNAGTRYDFYVLENCSIYKNTLINGEDRQDVLVDIKNYDFIPNYNLILFDKIISKDGNEKCPIIFNRTNYGTDKDWVSDKNDGSFIYPLIHSTPKSGVRYMYSSRNDKGHFGISKVIFGESGIGDVVIDMEGKYGMTQGAMAITIKDVEEANIIKDVLLSEKFNGFLKTVMWSNFRIDWRLFRYLKKDFWKEFI
jgi:hypothetical protein